MRSFFTCLMIPTLLGLLQSSDAAEEVELRLRNGTTMRGDVVREDDQSVTFRQRVVSKSGTSVGDLVIRTLEIVGRRQVPAAIEEYPAKAKGAGSTSMEQCSLAQWCVENGLREQAVKHAIAAVEQDSANQWARRILDTCGMMEVDRRWVVEADYLTTNKLARFDGKLIPAGEADTRKTLAKNRKEQEQLQTKVAAWEAMVANGAKLIAEQEKLQKDSEAESKKQDDVVKELIAKLKEWQTASLPKNATKGETDKHAKTKTDIDAKITAANTIGSEADRKAADARRKKVSLQNQKAEADKELPGAKGKLATLNGEIDRLAKQLPAEPAPAK